MDTPNGSKEYSEYSVMHTQNNVTVKTESQRITEIASQTFAVFVSLRQHVIIVNREVSAPTHYWSLTHFKVT